MGNHCTWKISKRSIFSSREHLSSASRRSCTFLHWLLAWRDHRAHSENYNKNILKKKELSKVIQDHDIIYLYKLTRSQVFNVFHPVTLLFLQCLCSFLFNVNARAISWKFLHKDNKNLLHRLFILYIEVDLVNQIIKWKTQIHKYMYIGDLHKDCNSAKCKHSIPSSRRQSNV